MTYQGGNRSQEYLKDAMEQLTEKKAEIAALWRFIDAADAVSNLQNTPGAIQACGGYERWRARKESLESELMDATEALQPYDERRKAGRGT